MTEFNNQAVGALAFTVTWTREGITHEERFIGRKFNPVNDIFPAGMRDALEGKQAGESVTLTYGPRRCIPRHRESRVLRLSLDRLRKKTVRGEPILPCQGRFYPQGHIDGLLDVYPDTLTPFRLIDLAENAFTADLNHPLAEDTVTISAQIQYMEHRDTGTYGSLTHWRETICDWGPGMQARHGGVPTDFFLPGFFDRPEKGDPAPPQLDRRALENVTAIRARHIEPGMRVLDFSPGAPPPSGGYDAAFALHGPEYAADPFALLAAVADRLPPGAPVVVAFGNRPDTAKTIRGWASLHEFERMGLVLEYLRRAGLDRDAGTVSVRNDWRDKDDPRFLETRGVSDSVFAVYGRKR